MRDFCPNLNIDSNSHTNSGSLLLQLKRAVYVLIVIFLVAAISIVLFSSNLLQQVNPEITVVSSSDSWPMFHHDLNHTGFSTSIAPGVSQPSLELHN